MSLEDEIQDLQRQISAANLYRCDDGSQLEMAKFNHRKKTILARFSEAEQARILQRYQLYKRLQGQAGALIRKKNQVASEDGERQVHVLSTHTDDIIGLFAQHYDAKAVHAEVLRLGLEVSYDVVRKFGLKHQKRIQTAQSARRENSLQGLRFTHRTGRMEVLHELFQDRQVIYKMTKSREDHKLLQATLLQMKQEVDGDAKFTLDVNVDVAVQEQSIRAQESLRKLNLFYVVLAGVAGQRGVDPAWVMSKLNNSYYAKLNGVLNPADAQRSMGQDFVFPSERTYDFDEIKRLDQQRIENQATEHQAARLDNRDLPAVTAQPVLDLKTLLLQKLQAQMAQTAGS